VIERVVVIECPADLAFLALLRQSIDALCESVMPDLDMYQLQLAVSELVAIIVIHAYQGVIGGKIEFRIALGESVVMLDLFDSGAAYEATEPRLPPSDALLEGGYGLFLMQQSLDVMQYSRGADQRNHWHLEKRLAVAAHQGGKTGWT